MNKKMLALTAISIISLAVAAIALTIALTIVSEYHINLFPAAPAPKPSSESSPTPAITPSPSPLAPFNPTIRGENVTGYLTAENLGVNGTSLIYGNINALNGSLYDFGFTLTNPSWCASSPPSYLQFVLTEENSAQPASPTDAILGMYTEGKSPIVPNTPDAAYSYYTDMIATASGNTLTFLFAPLGPYYAGVSGFSSSGFTVPSGFAYSFLMQIEFNIPGSFSLSVNIVSA